MKRGRQTVTAAGECQAREGCRGLRSGTRGSGAM
jgi:hypothetical protein